MTFSTLADIARGQGRDRPDDVALLIGDRRVTYGEIDERSNRVAQALSADGVEAGDRVAFLDKNGSEYFEVVFGAAKIGAVPCAVNWRLAASEAAFVVNDADSRVLVIGEDFLPLLETMESELTTVKRIVVIGAAGRHTAYEDWVAAAAADDPEFVSGPDEVTIQFYSSGTTGRPKGVMLTNRNCFATIEGSTETLNFGPGSVNHVVMPLFHVAGGFWAIMGLYHGVRNIVLREADPATILRDIATHGITHEVFVPALIQLLVRFPATAQTDLSSLELIVYGASPISESLLREAIQTFACQFVQVYGMTETAGSITLLRAADHELGGIHPDRLRSAGTPAPGVEIKVVDPDTLEEVRRGEVGEIMARSERNMAGYWRLPDETARTIMPDGFLRTGDAGYLDADGYLHIHDRIKDMIISGGENVYPAEVEQVLRAHPGVADIAVVAVPDERWGETGRAFIVPTSWAQPPAEDDIIAFARERLAHYKCPTSVEWVVELPRNPSGKVLKRELRRAFWADRERPVN